MEEARDFINAHIKKATKELKALQQELEKVKLQAKDAKRTRDPANVDAKKIRTGFEELRAELKEKDTAKQPW